MAVLFGTGRCFVLGAALASVLLAGPALALAPERRAAQRLASRLNVELRDVALP